MVKNTQRTVQLFCFAFVVVWSKFIKLTDVGSYGSMLHALALSLKSSISVFIRNKKDVYSHGSMLHALALGRMSITSTLFVSIVFMFTVIVPQSTPVQAVINDEINFQARILTASGGLIPDGNYHVEFKIYEGGDGVLGGGDETLAWTETHTTGNLVNVKNGYVSVRLGSVNDTLSSAVDWGEEVLWVTINIGGNGGTASWDGEMDPMMRFTSVPYAFNSNTLDGLDSTDFAQLDRATAQVVNSTNAAIYVNQTGTGNIIRLQDGGTDVLTIADGGQMTLTGDLSISGGTDYGVYYRDNSGNLATTGAGASGECFKGLDSGAPFWGSCSGTGDIIQGGNTLGEAVIIGSNDAYSLQFETGGFTNMTIADEGAVTFQNEVDSTSGFRILDADGGTPILNVDTVNERLGLGTATPSALLDVAGNAVLGVNSGNTLTVNSVATFNENITVAATKTLRLTGGTTAQRPASPTEGMIYFDTDTDSLLVYANGKWQADRGEYIIVAANDSTQAEKDSADYVADGTSDEDEINSALTDAAGGKVLLLAGTYTIDGSIILDDKEELTGVGDKTVITVADSYNTSIDFVTNSDTTNGNNSIKLSNFVLNGNKANQTGGTMRGLYFGDIGNGVSGDAEYGINIEGIVVKNFNNNAVEFVDSKYVIFSNNYIYDSGQYGFRFGGRDSVISSNIIEDNNAGGISLNTAFYNILSSNVLDDNGTYGIVVANSSYNVFNQNQITDTASFGMFISSGSQNSVSDNYFANNGGAGASPHLQVSGNDHVISNNTFYDTSGTGPAINLMAGATNVYLSDNKFTGVGAAGITDSGTNTMYAGQIDGSGNFDIQGFSGNLQIGINTEITGTLTVSSTLSADGNVEIGDANTDTLTINAGTSGSGITFSDTSFQSCTALETNASGVLVCGTDDNDNTTYTAGNDLDLVGTEFSIESQLDFVSAIVQDGSNLTLQTTTSGNIVLNTAGIVDVQGDLVVTGNSTFDGNMTIQSATDSVTAFQILDNDGGIPVFNVDTVNERVGIGTAAPARLLTVDGAGTNILAQFTSNDNRASIEVMDDDTTSYLVSEDGYTSIGGSSLLSSTNLNINNTTGAVGIGTVAPSAAYKLHVYESSDNSSKGSVFVQNRATYSSSGGTVYPVGLTSSVELEVANGASVTGTAFGSRSFGLRGITASDRGTFGSLYGLDVGFGHTDNGFSPTTTEVRGVNVVPYLQNGNITTASGLYIDSPIGSTGATVTNYYGLYQEDSSADNYFAGNVGIGDSSPEALLTVGNGDLFQVSSAGAVIAVGVNSGTGLIEGTGGLTAGGTITFSGLTSCTALNTNGSGEVGCDTSTYLTNASAFVQNGNTFGTGAVIGTNDNNSLSFETFDTVRATLSTAGNLSFAQASTIDVSALNGALTLRSNGTGAITLDSGTTGAVNVGTGANAKTVTIGNATGASSVVIQAGTGAINIGTNTIARTISIGNTTGASALNLNSGTGAINLNSGTGTINIGSTASARTVNLGTGAAAQTVTVGSTNTTSATTIQSGSGALNINSGTGTINLATSASARTVNIATAAAAQTLNIGSTNTTSITTINAGSGGIALTTSTTVSGLLTVDGATAGDSRIVLQADTDNNDESDNAYIRLLQDGATTDGFFGFAGNANVNPVTGGAVTGINANSMLIGTISNDDFQILTNNSPRLTITNTGNIGIGDTTPLAALTVGSGDLFQVDGATGDILTSGDLTINSNTELGDANTDTLTINAGSSGTGITFSDSSFQSCTALETNASGVLVCGTDDDSASTIGLQDAYNTGNTILATDANGDIDLTVSEATNFSVDITGTGSFLVQDSGTTALEVNQNGNTIIGGGTSRGKLTVNHTSATQVALSLQVRADQDANTDLAEFLDSTGTKRTWINEKGELRTRAAADNSVAFRIKDNSTSQTGHLLQIAGQVPADTLAFFDGRGRLGIGYAAASNTAAADATLAVDAYADGEVAALIRGNSASQTGDLLKVQRTTADGYDVLRVTSNGDFAARGVTNSTTAFQVIRQNGSSLLNFDTVNQYAVLKRGSSTITGQADSSVMFSAINNSGAATNTSISLESGASAQGRIYFGDTTDQDIGQLVYDNSDDSMRFITNAAERLRITSAGRVGIGATTPSYNLSFSGASNQTLGVEARASNAIGSNLTVSAGNAGTGASAFAGGALYLQGGNAAGTGNANGGNVFLSGGTGVGTGAKGLVVIETPTYSTATTQNCATNCTITQSNIDNNGAVVIDSTSPALTITLPDPTNALAGRVIYVTAANGSNDFTLEFNGGGQVNEVAMRANTTATMIWNGSDWTAAGASSSTTLQAAYDNTLTSAGGAELILNPIGGAADGLTIRNNPTTPIIGAIFEAQTSIGSNLFSVNNNANEFASNGGAETPGATTSTFPANTWSATPDGGTVSRYTTLGDYVATGQGSVSVVTSATANQGTANTLSSALTPNLAYTVSFAVRGTSSFSTLDVVYSPDGTNTATQSCTSAETVTQGSWSRIICSFTAPASGITSSNAVFIRQSDATAKTYYVENLSVTIKADVNHAVDGSVDDAGNFATNWTSAPAGGTVTRTTSTIYDTSGAVQIDTTATAGHGVSNDMTIAPAINTQYLVTFYARSSNTFDDIRVRYTRDGGTSFVNCVDYSTQSVAVSTWTRITCLFTSDGTTPTNAELVIDQTTGVARTFYVDALSVTLNTDTASNVKIGGGSLGGPVTLLTLDRSSGPPIAANNDAYLGSMYYDTTTGRIQCYEAGGWGTCGAPPNNIVNLNPEYAGSVLNGSGVGTMQADACANESGVLSVNTSLCASGEARNYYSWTSPQSTEQTYSIYVTYQLPATFDGFESDDTVQLTARVDNTTNADVTYEMFRSDGSNITQCGSGETGVVSSADTWQTVGINGNEATGCGFNSSAAGNFIIFKINLKSQSNANAYVSTLTFTTTGR